MHKWLAYAADRDLVAAQPRGSVYPEIYADMQSDGNFSGPLNQKHLYHGFLSGADVRRLVDPAWGGVWTTDKGRHITMFTTLRHPVERAVSCASGPAASAAADATVAAVPPYVARTNANEGSPHSDSFRVLF